MTLTASRLPSAPDYPDVRFLELPRRRVLVIDAAGDPGAENGYPATMSTLYPVAYTLKFALKPRGIAYKVGMPEGLFWFAEGVVASMLEGPADASDWRWQAILEIPAEASDDDIAAAIEKVRRGSKRRPAPAMIDRLRVDWLDEGIVAEITHIGPYEAEPPTIARLHAAIASAGLRTRGAHHEIYLGDPRTSDPAKLKTIIRQPVE